MRHAIVKTRASERADSRLRVFAVLFSSTIRNVITVVFSLRQYSARHGIYGKRLPTIVDDSRLRPPPPPKFSSRRTISGAALSQRVLLSVCRHMRWLTAAITGVVFTTGGAGLSSAAAVCAIDLHHRHLILRRFGIPAFHSTGDHFKRGQT
jgi:hypothetical protein